MKKKKNMVKEVFIVIVLLILVLLILAVTLYDYIPSNISVAEVRKYNPDSKTTLVKQEIAYTNGGDSSADGDSEDLITSLKSYSIDSADLNLYTTNKQFDKGNSNPFEYVDGEGKKITDTNSNQKSTSEEENPNSSTESSISKNKDSNVNNDTAKENNNDNEGSSNSSSLTNDGTTGTFFESPTSK